MAVYKSNEKTKDGRQWYYRLYVKDSFGINKQIKSKKYFTKAEAIEAEALMLLKKENATKKNFHIVALDYFNDLTNKVKESTLYGHKSCYFNNIKPFFEEFDINDINILNINEWKSMMCKKGFKKAYLDKNYSILCSILDYAIKYYGLNKNIARISGPFETKDEDVKKDENKIRYISYEDFNKFVSVIDDYKWYAFFNFLYYTGMRKGEIQALTWKDIKDNIIIVNKTLSVKTEEHYKITNTKNRINRTITMNSKLIEIMNNYKKEVQKYDDFNENWFVFGCSRFLPQTTIDKHKLKYFEKANIKPITIHEFRHSHVSLLINEYIKKSKENNMKIDTAKFFLLTSSRLGHSVDVMQKTYLHLFPNFQDEIVDLLDNL